MTISVACWVYIRLCVLMLICYFQLSLQKKIVHLHPTYLNFTLLMLITFSFSVDQLNYVFKVQKFIHPFSRDWIAEYVYVCIHVIELLCYNWRFANFWLEIWSYNWRFFIDVFIEYLMHVFIVYSFCLFQ